MVRKETINSINVYDPQMGLEEAIKVQFWEDLEEIVHVILICKKIFIGGDLNGRVGKENKDYNEVHCGFGFKNIIMKENQFWISQ